MDNVELVRQALNLIYDLIAPALGADAAGALISLLYFLWTLTLA